MHLRKYNNSHSSFNDLSLVKCMNCELVFANPMPSEVLLEKFNSTYFTSAHGGVNLSKTSQAFFSGIAKIRKHFLKKYLKLNKINFQNILEIGPGPGYFAKNWLSENNNKYFVLESDSSCHASLKKNGAIILDIESYNNNKIIFDIVIISHVLEHVSNPKSFIDFSTKYLKKGGVLFLDVPCNDYEHKELDEPHLLFFNKTPMRFLLEMLNFKNIEINYYGNKISKLKKKRFINKVLLLIRSLLISYGFHFLFGLRKNKLSMLDSSFERAVMLPYKAHLISDTPAWWLRAFAIKN
jgi:SAM-dependent methyltransferase